MHCPQCGTQVLEGKSFCHACGTRLGEQCKSCGATVEPGFKFCPDCGQPLQAANGAQPPSPLAKPAAAAPPVAPPSVDIPEALAQKIRASRDAIEGERKLVTVLFCDLAGSTAMAEKLDPEEYHDLLDEYLEIAFREIYRLEGIVNQIAGDGFMALFGAPIAHEDAPQRAVRAAIEIHHNLFELDGRLQRTRGLALNARVGINTGPVVVGSVGSDLRMDYSAIGDTTNLAARLESLAQPGSILVSESTHRLLRGSFITESVGPLTVKGKSEAVSAFRIIGERVVSPGTADLAHSADGGLTPFVGRDAEIQQMLSCFDRVSEGLPQLVTIVSEAGLGKSRLVYEFKELLQDKRVVWFETRCSAWNQMAPYYPWVTMLRRFFDVGAEDPPELVRATIAKRIKAWDPNLSNAYPWLCRLLAVWDGSDSTPTEEGKLRSFEAITQLVFSEGDMTSPVVMVIEDLHWMDEASLEMINEATSRMGSGPIMMVLTHRPDFHHPWRTHAAFTQMRLRRLSDAHVAELLNGLTGGLPGDLEARIREKAEGSPFLIEEITRSLIEDGTLSCDGDRCHLTRPVEEIRLPGTVQEVIAARLDRLENNAKRVLQVAAVLGRQFSRSHLKRLFEDEFVDVDAELADLERRGIVHRRNLFSQDEFRFGESLTQEVAYEGLLLKQRRQLHERIGRLLESAAGAADAERTALITHHFGRSDNLSKSIHAMLHSAREAETVPAYATAAKLYRDAWDSALLAMERGEKGEFRDLALQAVNGVGRMAVIYNVPDPGDNKAVVARAAELAEEAGSVGMLASIRTFQGMMMMRGDAVAFARGLALAEDGLAIAQKAGLRDVAAFQARGVAWAYTLDARFDIALRMIDWALAEMEEKGPAARATDIYCSARWMRERICFYADNFESPIAAFPSCYALAESIGNRTIRSASSSAMSHLCLIQGKYEEALVHAERSLEIALALGHAVSAATPAAVSIIASREIGRQISTQRMVAIMEKSQVSGADVALNSPICVEALLAVGLIAQAEEWATMSEVSGGGALQRMHTALAVAEVACAGGRDGLSEAHRAFERAIELAEAANVRSVIAQARLGLANIAFQSGNTRGGIDQRNRAVAIARELGLEHLVRRAARLDAERLEGEPAANDLAI